MSQIDIREMKNDELDAVIDLHLEGLDRELDLFNQILSCKSVDYSGKKDLKLVLQHMLHVGECTFFVAYQDKQLVGYCLATKKVYPVENPKVTGCINGIYVSPKFRKAGVGRKLYQLAEQWFKKEEINFVELYHMMNDSRAEAFWESFGFKKVQYYCSKLMDS